MTDYSRNISWLSLLVIAAVALLLQIPESSGDFLPPRHIKLRGPPAGHHHPSLKFTSKRPRHPVRVHHIHLNYPPPPPHHPHPVKYVSGPPRKYKPNIPVLKSHFNPSPPAHYIAPIIDHNEGAIHTIPAPNLGPNGDRPIPPPALISSIAGSISPFENAIKVHPISQGAFDSGYEVHESYYNEQLEPSKSNIGLPFYAPDPDPSLPAPQVPVTRDPNSHPSNGKAPLDLILQQQLENQQQHARVSLAQPSPPVSHLFNYQSDPNSQFLQAFQDQYKFPQQYDGEYHAQGTQHKTTAVAPESDELDYDSGADVRYSYSQSGHSEDQDDAASEHLEDDGEVISESDSKTYGQRIAPKKKN